jgi:hypothetical protein
MSKRAPPLAGLFLFRQRSLGLAAVSRARTRRPQRRSAGRAIGGQRIPRWVHGVARVLHGRTRAGRTSGSHARGSHRAGRTRRAIRRSRARGTCRAACGAAGLRECKGAGQRKRCRKSDGGKFHDDLPLGYYDGTTRHGYLMFRFPAYTRLHTTAIYGDRSQSGRGAKTTRRANHSNRCPARFAKIFDFPSRPNHRLNPCRPAQQRGVS